MVRLDKKFFDWILVDFCESQTSNIWDGFEWSFQDYLMDVDVLELFGGGDIVYKEIFSCICKSVQNC